MTPTTTSFVPFRFVDALVGGGVALVVNQLARPANPLTALADEAHLIFEEVAGVILDSADALERHDVDASRAALARARGADELVDRLRTAVAAAREALWVDVHRRRRMQRVFSVEAAAAQLDYLVRNVRVLARATVGLNRLAPPPPLQLVRALRMTADAVRSVERAMAADLAGDEEAASRHAEEATATALDALRTGRELLTPGAPMSVVMIVGQLRASTIDLLRATGIDDVMSLGMVDEVLGLPPI